MTGKSSLSEKKQRFEYTKYMDRLDNIFEGGNRFLSPADREFAFTLMKELEQFQYQAPKDRALMFRPLGGFQRYLIHKVAQTYPKLTSFSIGDDHNRRTVVCFKTKRKNQPMAQRPHEEASFGNEYVDSPQRSVESERGRRGTPPARSRDSSKNRKRSDQHPPQSNRGSVSSNRLPKPLRPKKTKRDQMKKSRSLQSSPLLDEESRSLDERRGRSWSQSGKQQLRSSSLKPVRGSKNKSRTASPNRFEDQRKSSSLRPNISEHNLQRRRNELHIEGKVINGDIEDPYSCRDSDSEARVDAEVIRNYKEQHRRSKHREVAPPESDSSEAESDSEMEAPSRRDADSNLENDLDSDTASTDERPPSYDSLRRSTSVKKAERNLQRIKQVESHRARSGSEESARSGAVESKPKHSHAKQKSSTLPKSTSKNEKKQAPVAKRAHTLKANANRKKTPGEGKRAVKHQATSSSPAKGSKLNYRESMVEANGSKKMSRDSLDDLVGHSNPELFYSLPDKTSVVNTELGDQPSVIESKTQCDGGTQTEFTGTLPKKKNAPPPQSVPNIPSSQAKSMGELLAAMMQALGIHSQGSAPAPTPAPTPAPNYNPNINAFHQHMQNLGPPPSFPPLPPHLVHHLYMSWLGAYYAGATGAWPPPAPPSFIVSSASNQQSGTTPFDFLSQNFSTFPNNSNQENEKCSEKRSNYPCPDPMYSHTPGPHPQQVSGPDDDGRSVRDEEEKRASKPSSSHSMSSSFYEPGGGSLAPSDSDASSASKKSQVTMTTNPKGEVIVYVRSRPSSRSSSIGAPPRDGPDIDSTNDQYDPASKTSRPHDVKKGKQRPSSLKKRSTSKRDKIGEMTSSNANSDRAEPASEKHEKSVEAPSVDLQHGEEEDGSAADASQEEIILSLRKAPLATIEDDEFLSTSVASSSTSLHISESKFSKKDNVESEEEENSGSFCSSSSHIDVEVVDRDAPVEPCSLPPSSSDVRLTDPIAHSDEEFPDEESAPVSPPHNEAASSDVSSISDGNRADDPSDSSYDADQSRADEAGHARRSSRDVEHNLEGEKWEKECQKFVEIYNFPPTVSDIEISRYLTKYRGLRMSRVGRTVALCILPTPEDASEFLKEKFPIFSTRPLPEATEKSRRKARIKLAQSGVSPPSTSAH